MRKSLIECYKNFEIYEISESKNRDGDIWIKTDKDLEYYIDTISGYCRNVEDAKRFINKFWEEN